MRILSIVSLVVIGSLAVGCKGNVETGDGGTDMSVADCGVNLDIGFQRITEDDIAAILDAINTGEILEAQTAEPHGLDSGEVLAYANMMLDMHTAAKARQDALFAQIGLTPTMNMYTDMLNAEAMRVVARLSRLTDMPLDQAYIDTQVSGHQNALDLINFLLIPNATTPALVTELLAFRDVVAAHLAEAKSIQAHMVGLD